MSEEELEKFAAMLIGEALGQMADVVDEMKKPRQVALLNAAKELMAWYLEDNDPEKVNLSRSLVVLVREDLALNGG